MNNQSTTPNLDSPVTSQFPVRVLKSPYFILRTPVGGYYLDSAFNELLVKSPVNGISLFLAEAKRAEAAGGDTRGGSLGEVRYQPRENLRPLRYINEGTLEEFTKAARDFYKGGADSSAASIRQNFRLPDPGKEPDAYWVYGDRFAPRLLILWGCEKEQASSLPLVGDGRSVVKELRSKGMSWTRLFREGVELSRQKDALQAHLAFPILAADGTLTDVMRLKDGQYVREAVSPKSSTSAKLRPLTRLSAGAIEKFKKVAEDFYRKGHGQTPSGTPTYEQELRRGFRLPDPELRPDAYFVVGRPLSEQLLILCPLPTVKDAEEIAQMERDLKWADEKAKTAEDKDRAIQLRQQYEQDLANHKLYKRYFYTSEECLPLTTDVAKSASPAAQPAGSLAPLALPDPMLATQAGKSAGQTVVSKLKPIDWGKVMAIGGSLLGLFIVAILATWFFWPKQLKLAGAEMSNDPVLDPHNERNVIAVKFSSALAVQSTGVPFGDYHLTLDGENIALQDPKLDPADHSILLLTLAQPGKALAERGKYALTLHNAKDKWNNVLASTDGVPVSVADKRGPSIIVDKVEPLSPEVNNAIVLHFDEPMDKESVEDFRDYTLGLNVTNARMRDEQTVVLKTEHPFESGEQYSLRLDRLTDLARNPLTTATLDFTYAKFPMRIESISAESQLKVKVRFNKPFDPESVLQAVKIDKLKIGGFDQLDPRELVLTLTNSFMTTGTYTLQITGLKELSAKSKEVLNSSSTFGYDGPVDKTPPKLVEGGFTSTSTRLEMPFNKDLLAEAASKEVNYTLKSANGLKVQAPFGAELSADSSSTVVLNFANKLPDGKYNITYSGVQDLVGNTGSGSKDFSIGMTYIIEAVKPAKIANSARTTIKFILKGEIDVVGEKPKNFQLEDSQKVPLRDIDIDNVKFEAHGGVTGVTLELSKALPINDFQVRFFNLKLAKETWAQTGLVTTGTGSH